MRVVCVCVWLRIRDGVTVRDPGIEFFNFLPPPVVYTCIVSQQASLSQHSGSLSRSISPRLSLTARTRIPLRAPHSLSVSLSLSTLDRTLKHTPSSFFTHITQNRTAQKTYLAVAISLAGASFGPSTGSRAEGAQPIWRVVSRAHCAISLTAAASLSGSSSYRGVNMKPPTGTK